MRFAVAAKHLESVLDPFRERQIQVLLKGNWGSMQGTIATEVVLGNFTSSAEKEAMGWEKRRFGLPNVHECANCSQGNRSTAAFCIGCGQPLIRRDFEVYVANRSLHVGEVVSRSVFFASVFEHGAVRPARLRLYGEFMELSLRDENGLGHWLRTERINCVSEVRVRQNAITPSRQWGLTFVQCLWIGIGAAAVAAFKTRNAPDYLTQEWITNLLLLVCFCAAAIFVLIALFSASNKGDARWKSLSYLYFHLDGNVQGIMVAATDEVIETIIGTIPQHSTSVASGQI